MEIKFRANSKIGFTLVELLVVVLIIGILAAIALPLYTRSVERSRASEALSVVQTIANAEERHFLATGAYTSDYNHLDVSLPSSKYFNINVDGSIYNIRATRGGNYDKYHFRYFMRHINKDSYPGSLLCLVPAAKPEYEYVCQSLGGTDPHTYKHMSTTQIAYYIRK